MGVIALFLIMALFCLALCSRLLVVNDVMHYNCSIVRRVPAAACSGACFVNICSVGCE